MAENLFNKYDIPAPRYTSYPTVPYWSDNPTTDQWTQFLRTNMQRSDVSWSLYLHIPFCETLCTFCGCNTSITKNHDREEPYLQLLFKEWENYLRLVPELRDRPLSQFHLGGGSPTFFSAKNLGRVVERFLKDCPQTGEFEGAIEVDPRRTNEDQLRVLRDLGFNRVSLGVQDFDPEVQRLVNRIQPYEMTEKITRISRDLGYQSLNFDLIYGLPSQTEAKVRRMVELTCQLRPDRIALYSLAVVPWIKPAQKLFKDEDLPKGEEKRRLYEISREMLLGAGYIEIGMDHFSLPTDSLAIAARENRLHRNFMGYTDRRTQVLLGLGVSSISETPECFHQNEKTLPVYEKRVAQGEVPTFRGHILTAEDQQRREQILKFMTEGSVLLKPQQKEHVESFLSEMIKDQLVQLEGLTLKTTEAGKPFLRNACMALDERFRRQSPSVQVFSKAL